MADCLKILVLGAGGQMTSRTAKALGGKRPELRYRLADISEHAAGKTAEAMSNANTEVLRLDLYDHVALASAIRDADFVIHGAGPFHKTAKLVRPLCIENGVDYMDIDDDVESSLEAIELHDAAVANNAAIYSGCGASPGLTNIIARKAIDMMERADDVEVAWCVGDEENQQLGRAVIEHTMHIGAGDCVTWRDGVQVTHQSFNDSVIFPMGPALGDTRLYECAHPETVHIPNSFPSLNNVTCWGGMHPAPVNGLLKGVARAELSGDITMDEAVDFFKDMIEGRSGSWKVWRKALKGAWTQIRSRESSMGSLLSYMIRQTLGGKPDTRMGIAARVTGLRDNQEAVVTIASNDHDPGSALDSMEAATGLSQAAFMLQALDHRSQRHPGCLFPEKWADPDRFLTDLQSLGDRPDANLLIEPIIEVAS